MSKFLKFIVNLFLTLAIIVTAGIIVPPLLGVNTTIVDTASMDTNLPLGSVTYSRNTPVLELEAGDEILKESGTSTYAYIVQEGDAASGEFTVVSATEPDATSETVILRNSVSEVVLTVPYIGYVVVAMQSLEGRIIIALVILFIIILFILSELWKKRDDDDDEDDGSGNDAGILGNVQTASAEKTGDAGKTIAETDISADYSKNATGDSGYVVMGQDTSSTTEANDEPQTAGEMHEILKDMRADEADVQVTGQDAVPGGRIVEESVSEADSQDTLADENQEIVTASPTKNIDVQLVNLMNAQAVTEEPVVPEISGDTKVFSESFSSQIQAVAAENEAVSGSDNETERVPEQTESNYMDPEEGSAEHVEETIEKDLIVDTAADSQSDKFVEAEPEQNSKKLWSWTDEPFESELDGDSWNGFLARSSAGANEYPERFTPVERMTRQEIIEQARMGGNEPKIQRDEVTGIEIIDYSDLL